MKVGSIRFTSRGKSALATFTDGKWTADDPAIADVLQGMWEIADRAPWRGFAARGHVVEMAELLGGKAELVKLPEYDGPAREPEVAGFAVEAEAEADGMQVILDRLGIDRAGLAVLHVEDIDELLDDEELAILTRAGYRISAGASDDDEDG